MRAESKNNPAGDSGFLEGDCQLPFDGNRVQHPGASSTGVAH